MVSTAEGFRAGAGWARGLRAEPKCNWRRTRCRTHRFSGTF